jgi:hypothetical protein
MTSLSTPAPTPAPGREKQTRSGLFHFQQFGREHGAALSRWKERRQACKQAGEGEGEGGGEGEGEGESAPPPAPVAAEDLEAAATLESDVVREIRTIYETHNPGGLAKVPGLLQRYAGSEEELLLRLRDKYAPHPPSAELAAAPADASLGATHVFMTFRVRGAGGQRVRMRLFAAACPLAAENFRSLCAGDKVCDRV